ncbi:MAG: hypothetical protein KF873_12200 [Gemmataceae bacterium]|nr:hypothetical protein [Gemmataceae bacterium]
MRSRNVQHRLMIAIAVSLSGLMAPSLRAAEASIEAQLLAEAGPLMRECDKRGYRNVGVLKFSVSPDGGKTFPNQVGTLNLHLANRLEQAMFIKNAPVEPKIGVTRNASAVAAKIDGADHLTPDGRTKLFTGKYPLLWGTQTVAVDAFVVGVATVSSNQETISIQLYLIDPTLHQPFGKPFAVQNRAALLAETGASYSAPNPSAHRAIDDAAQKQKDAPPAVTRRAVEEVRHKIDLAAFEQARDPNRPHPLSDEKAPLSLVIRYDGRAQPYEFKAGRAYVAEPGEDVKKVELELTRNWDESLKAVVKVNGVNTLYKQTAPDPHCLGWLLDKKDGKTLLVDGYQVTADESEKFRILSQTESKVNEQRYGSYVGTITVSVFREAKAMPLALATEREKHLEIVSMATPPKENAREDNYNAALDNFLKSAHRGLIGEGERLPNRVSRVTRLWDPTPVMTAAVVYYKAQP